MAEEPTIISLSQSMLSSRSATAAATAAMIGLQGGLCMLRLVVLMPLLHAFLLPFGVLLAPPFEILPPLLDPLRFPLVACARSPRLLFFRMRAPFAYVRLALGVLAVGVVAFALVRLAVRAVA